MMEKIVYRFEGFLPALFGDFQATQGGYPNITICSEKDARQSRIFVCFSPPKRGVILQDLIKEPWRKKKQIDVVVQGTALIDQDTALLIMECLGCDPKRIRIEYV